MKGFSTPINILGLRADAYGGRDSHNSTRCLNARIHKNGLEGYIPNVLPFPPITLVGGGTLDVTIDWPFPQLFRTDSGLYVGTRVGLYSVANVAGTWTATLLTGAYTHGVYWPWTLANAPLFPVFASGDCLVYYDYDNSYWAIWNKTYSGETLNGSRWHSDWYQPVSACYNAGQIIMVGSGVASGTPSQSRTVRWSEIGQFDFLGKTANVRKNEAGHAFATQDDTEIIMRVLPLGKSTMVYTSLSVIRMKPVAAPAATFAIKPVGDIFTGINNPLAVGGNEHKHLMVGVDGCLYLIDTDTAKLPMDDTITVKKLDYKEYLQPLVDGCSIYSKNNIISVVYNKARDEFYISNGQVSYIYNDNGLTETSMLITSVADFENINTSNNTAIASLVNGQIGFLNKTSNQEQFYYESDVLDFKMNAIKTIEGISLHGTFDEKSNVGVMVKWRNDKRGTFRETPWKRVSPEGFTSPLVSGVEVKICVRGISARGIEINTIMAHWKITDKRFVRGMYNVSGS